MNRRMLVLTGLAFAAAASLMFNRGALAVGGNSITSPDTEGRIHTTSLALDANGNPVVTYRGLGGLKVLHCNDPNCSGGDESITVPDDEGGAWNSLALDPSGNPVVTYPGDSGLKVLHCNDPNCSGGDESITTPDRGELLGITTSLALDDGGNPVVSYFDNPNYDLKVLHCNDPNCAGGDESITSPDTDEGVGWGSSLALDHHGYPVVSYYDQTNRTMKVLRCNDANCSGGDDSITTPDTSGGVGSSSSLALDDDGNPVISYAQRSEEGPGALKVLHCNDPNCLGGDESITSPDSVTAGYVSLELDAAGNPVVSYLFDRSRHPVNDGDLRVLRCNDPHCSGGDESVTSPETGDAVGRFNSLKLDALGNPVVSYAPGVRPGSSGREGLRLLHCGDPNCSGVPAAPTPSPAPTPIPQPTVEGGVSALPATGAAEPSASGAGSIAALAPLAATVGAVALGAAWYARRRRVT